MKHYTVLLRSAKEAAALVDLVSLCPGAAELCVGEDRMDAKSFMGVLGVAMGNAPPEAVAAADVQTDTNNNDGVAKAIRRWVLGEEV